MPSVSEHLPRVSFIMPTLNVEALLDNALSSITRQTYPRDRYEILLADAHSTDRTREIAKKYNAIVLDDDGKNMEEGKRLALRHATGEYIVFVDADNEISHPDYVELAVRALAAHPQALGVESYYLSSPRMSSFCAYITHRLHISDPLAWVMSARPKLVARDGEVERWTLPGDSLSYPLGANGFVFRRADLESVKAGEHFQDTHAALHLMRAGKREWLRIRGRGVHHYYVQTLWGFVQKRRRATVHFLQVQEQVETNWMKEKPAVPIWVAGIYCVTFAGPLWHTLRGLVRDRDLCWLWHTPTCLGAVLGNAWAVWTYKRRDRNKGGGGKSLVAELQVKQELKFNTEPDPGRDFDLAVCYRIYPRVSANPILGFKDKLALVQLNLETFKEAIGNLKIKIWVLLDHCPPAYAELVKSIFPQTPIEFIALGGEGNEATFARQIDILAGQRDSALVYFAEDDYLYLPGSLAQAVAFMRRHPEVDALTVADHLDYHRRYVDRIRSREHREGDRRWRTVVATALTFMIRQPTLIETAGVFKTYCRGNSDLGLWMALTKLRVFNPWCCIRGFGDGKFIPGSQALAWWHAWRYILFGRRCTLWAPSPTLATHMEKRSAATGVDWEQLLGARARILQENARLTRLPTL
jgi:glycosyltransferase involved in cell wall biosynthesis